MAVQTRPAVLAGVDGSAQSLAALSLAADEATRRRQPLRVICAALWPLYAAALHTPAAVVLDTSLSEPQAMLDRAVVPVRERHPDLEVSTEVIVGGAAGILVSESGFASVLVVGGRGSGGFAGMLAGSVATQVAAHARCPIIIVRPDRDAPASGPVVVGVDGIERTRPAVEFAFEEAATRETSLTAIHVWSEPPRSPADASKPVAYEHDEAYREATRLLAEAVAGYQEKYPEVPVRRETVRSRNPAAELRRVSEGAGLVVVGSRGRGGFSGLLLGSVSQALIQHSHCPVAVVRSGR